MQPSVGRIVHYVLAEGPNKGHVRPAIIVRVWGPECVQLQVFTDGSVEAHSNDGMPGVVWKTSVLHKEPAPEGAVDDYLGTWRWPPRA